MSSPTLSVYLHGAALNLEKLEKQYGAVPPNADKPEFPHYGRVVWVAARTRLILKAIMLVLAALLLAVLNPGGSARAQGNGDGRYAAAPAWHPEVRFGVIAQDPSGPEGGTVSVSAELLFSPFQSRFQEKQPWYIPKIHAGAVANLSGKTSYAYTGLTWTLDLTEKVFLEGAFGVAAHNGDTGKVAGPGRAALGCSWAFREAGSVGYRVNKSWSAMITLQHASNAGICAQNRGLTNIGLRLGYRF